MPSNTPNLTVEQLHRLDPADWDVAANAARTNSWIADSHAEFTDPESAPRQNLQSRVEAGDFDTWEPVWAAPNTRPGQRNSAVAERTR